MDVKEIFKQNSEFVKNSGYSVDFSQSEQWVLIKPATIKCCWCEVEYEYNTNNSFECPHCGKVQIEDSSIFMQGENASDFINEAMALYNQYDDIELDIILEHLAKPYIECC